MKEIAVLRQSHNKSFLFQLFDTRYFYGKWNPLTG